MGKLVTLGLAEIKVGDANTLGAMPGSMAKIGSVYRDTCKIEQAASEVTEHFEEGKAAPMVRKKQKGIPTLTFSIMDPDVQVLIDYIGGSDISGGGGAPKWGFDGSETTPNRAIRVMSEQGLWIDMPNADIEAVINADMSAKGLFMVDFTVTPMAVSSGKPIHAYDGSTGITVDPTSLQFQADGNTEQTITVSSSGSVTYAAAPSSEEWLIVTYAGKVVSVSVSENENTAPRSTVITIAADGLTAYVQVTQAGASS